MRSLFVLLAACSSVHVAIDIDAPAVDAPPDAPPDAYDHSFDPHARPIMFTGVFVPGVAQDPALAQLAHVAVIQTYRATSSTQIADDLGSIFARGAVAHLNLEPDTSDVSAAQIASALAAHAGSRVIVTYGAEMNGNWTAWGCQPAAQYIAHWRAAHSALDDALARAGIDARRARWAYGPNATSSANCGSIDAYYPGHAWVDLLGLSAYRSGAASVDDAVMSPIDGMFASLGYPGAWQQDRFVLLQTGSRAMADRDAWIGELVQRSSADPRIAGLVYFDAADWAVPPASLANVPASDPALDGIFTPYFWDVPYDHPAFPAIQGLRDAGVTSGCAVAPARFCPDDPISAADASALIARAFAGAHVELADPVTEPALAAALASLGASPPAAMPTAATRARAAVLIARAAHLVPEPL